MQAHARFGGRDWAGASMGRAGKAEKGRFLGGARRQIAKGWARGAETMWNLLGWGVVAMLSAAVAEGTLHSFHKMGYWGCCMGGC